MEYANQIPLWRISALEANIAIAIRERHPEISSEEAMTSGQEILGMVVSDLRSDWIPESGGYLDLPEYKSVRPGREIITIYEILMRMMFKDQGQDILEGADLSADAIHEALEDVKVMHLLLSGEKLDTAGYTVLCMNCGAEVNYSEAYVDANEEPTYCSEECRTVVETHDAGGL